MPLDESYELDAIDTRLLNELQVDAKISLKRVGEKVGLSAPAVMERVRKLEQAGVIRGYHAQIDARRVGIDVSGFIGVMIKNPTRIQAFEGWIHELPEVLECHHVTGGFTMMLKIKARNTSALEKLISQIRGFDGVDGTETMVVLSTSVERTPVMLQEPEVDPPRRRKRK